MGSVNIQHDVILHPQPTGMTCWSASATMLLGTKQSIGPGRASLGSSGGLASNSENIAEFARANGFQLYYPQCWAIEGLIELIARGPFAVLGRLPSLHAIVVGGMQGDGTDSGTLLNIFDPWPPTQGKIYPKSYSHFTFDFPLATIYILQRRG